MHKIVILKCKPQSMLSFEQYLANRDWQVHSTSALKTAIAAMIKNKPDYVFIAADHPNKKVKLLPKLLAQALKVKVIGFLEGNSPVALRSLNDLKMEYVLFPPVSGPSIERLIARMKKDELRALEQADKDAQRAAQRESPGNSSGEAFDDTSDTEGISTVSKKHKKGSDYYLFQGEKSEEMVAEQGSAAKMLEQLLQEEAATEDEQEPNLVRKDLSKMHEIATENEGEDNSEMASGLTDFQRMKTTRAQGFTPPPPPKKPTRIKVQDHIKSRDLSDNDSIFVKGAQAALDDTVQTIKDIDEIETVQTSARVACITVDSPRFQGYLVAAMGAERTIDDSFTASLKTKLVEFLKKHGEIIKDSDLGMDLKLETVDFEDWAADQAEFLRKSIHGDTEVAMAFFPNTSTQARLEESANENMLQMDIAELKDDVAVEFDMYIYMPTNNRYLLYTPQGRKMGGNQKDRLVDKGIQKIHLRKDSQGQVKKYRAQVFLNDKIAAYRAAAKKKSGS